MIFSHRISVILCVMTLSHLKSWKSWYVPCLEKSTTGQKQGATTTPAEAASALQQRLCWAQLMAVWEELRKGEISLLFQITQQDLQIFPRETQKRLLLRSNLYSF